ncbi:MAG: hypothetical protein IJV24_01360 [Prevotella sp.]|nr:hypothetical protein [Prevotella sp.]
MAVMELNEVVLEGEAQTLSLMAHEGQITCLTGADDTRLTRLLEAMMGFEVPRSGYICIDGEPLTESTVGILRSMMAYAPRRLADEGEIRRYAAPSVQDVFDLRANRDLPISNGLLAEETRRAGGSRLLAVAVLRQKPMLLADQPPVEAFDYLRALAHAGRTVIVASHNAVYVEGAERKFEF